PDPREARSPRVVSRHGVEVIGSRRFGLWAILANEEEAFVLRHGRATEPVVRALHACLKAEEVWLTVRMSGRQGGPEESRVGLQFDDPADAREHVRADDRGEGIDEIAALRFRPSSELAAKVREVSHVEP